MHCQWNFFNNRLPRGSPLHNNLYFIKHQIQCWSLKHSGGISPEFPVYRRLVQSVLYTLQVNPSIPQLHFNPLYKSLDLPMMIRYNVFIHLTMIILIICSWYIYCHGKQIWSHNEMCIVFIFLEVCIGFICNCSSY